MTQQRALHIAEHIQSATPIAPSGFAVEYLGRGHAQPQFLRLPAAVTALGIERAFQRATGLAPAVITHIARIH